MKNSIFIALLVTFGAASAMAADPSTIAPAAQAEAMKLGQPGDNHKHLNDLVGNWKYTSKWWAAPGAKPETTEGKSTAKWVLDGRFVQQEVTGKAMGQDFSGIAYTGYDNARKEIQSIWMDSMSTSITMTTGQRDAKTKVTKETGMMPDYMQGGKIVEFRNETKIKNKNSYTFSMFSKTPEGKEFKTMEMEYTRVQ